MSSPTSRLKAGFLLLMLLASLSGCRAPAREAPGAPSGSALPELEGCRLFEAAWRRASTGGDRESSLFTPPLTIFAPCDAALEDRRASLLGAGRAGQEACLALVRAHVSAGRTGLSELLSRPEIRTRDGRAHPVVVGDSTVRVGPALLLRADRPVRLGVLHTVGRPLSAIEDSRGDDRSAPSAARGAVK